MTLPETTRTFLREQFPSLKNTRFLVGVSGGPDSMVLLDVMVSLGEELGFSVIPLHYNYRFHGRSDEAFSCVTEYCEDRGLTPVATSLRRPGEHREASGGLEARARNLRFEFFRHHQKRFDAAGVFLGHHRQDQVETILLNLGRGCGPGALAGMSSVVHWNQLTVYRPFLEVPESRIKDYARSKNVDYLIDPTNEDESYARNKLRHTVIPEWERVQPDPVEAIVNLGGRVERENDFWEQFLARNVRDWSWSGEFQVHRPTFGELHEAAQFRYLRSEIETLAGSLTGWNEGNLRDIRDLFTDGRSGARLDLPGGVLALNEYDRGCVTSLSLERAGTVAGPIEPPRELNWLETGTLEIGERSPEDSDRTFSATIAVDRLDSMRLRTWEKGDVIRRDGESVKLKEIFERERVPYRARRYWPIVEVDGEVYTLPGLTRSRDPKHPVAVVFRPDHPAFDQCLND